MMRLGYVCVKACVEDMHLQVPSVTTIAHSASDTCLFTFLSSEQIEIHDPHITYVFPRRSLLHVAVEPKSSLPFETHVPIR